MGEEEENNESPEVGIEELDFLFKLEERNLGYLVYDVYNDHQVLHLVLQGYETFQRESYFKHVIKPLQFIFWLIEDNLITTHLSSLPSKATTNHTDNLQHTAGTFPLPDGELSKKKNVNPPFWFFNKVFQANKARRLNQNVTVHFCFALRVMHIVGGVGGEGCSPRG